MAKATPNQPLHPSFSEKVSVKVEHQLPDFVKKDHPTFVAFLEAYYEYMEQQGKPYEIIGNLNNYADLGKTTDEFLRYFKKQFAIDIPEQAFNVANKPLGLKRLRDFYRAKGSEKSFQFFFRLLYNQEIEMYFPSVDILRTSDGRYDKSQIVRVIDASGSDQVFNLLGKIITGSISNAKALVESVLNESVGSTVVSTIYLSGTVGTFVGGETITDGNTTFNLGQMLTKVSIDVNGNNYTLGDTLPIVGGGISNSGGVIKVSRLSEGNIMKVMCTNGGSGYVAGEKLTVDNTGVLGINGRSASVIVKSVDGSGMITELELENTGRGYTALPTISGGTGTNAQFSIMGWNVGGIKEVSIDNNGFGFTSTPTTDLTGLGDGTAQATITVGAYVGDYNVGFTGDKGFLSANKYIQDSNYYQLYSYVITAGETIDKWRAFVKRAVHPVGLALFGRYQLISNLSTKFKITGIPQSSKYTIIFHDGTIEPPKILDLKIDSCEGMIEWIIDQDDYGLITANVDETDDFGSTTSVHTDGEDYEDVNENVGVYIAPVKCQTYEQDLGIQKLIDGGFDDYLFVNTVPSRFRDFGLIDEAPDNPADYGWVTQAMSDVFSQLRLGPLKRTLDQQKFNKQGGYSQKWGVGTQSGTSIESFKNESISDYVFFGGSKHKKLTNATITQYVTGDEANALPPAP